MEYYKNLDINDIDGEFWKEIEGYEGLYWVSNLGRIKSKRVSKFKIKTQSLNKGGYLNVKLCTNYVSKSLLVHRIVASEFIGKYTDELRVTNHKNNIRTDNRAVNLEICNHSYNNKYAYDFGNKKPIITLGSNNPYTNTTPLVKIDLFGNYISEFKTAREASLDIFKSRTKIRVFELSKNNICSNKGFIFMYKHEYDIIKKHDGSVELPTFRSYIGGKRQTIHTNKLRKIVQLDNDNNLIEIFESFKLAEEKIGKKGVLDVCRKRVYKDKDGYTKHYNKCGGYNWMYYEDFKKINMNIIEAIQQAENGALITNNFLKFTHSFLKYMGSGVFYQYELVDDKPVYKYEVRDFSTAYVLSTGWEALQVNYFENEKSNEEENSDVITPSCQTCYYSSNGKHSCDRHVNKLKPDYSKGVECAYNNHAHYRPFENQ